MHPLAELLAACDELDAFWRRATTSTSGCGRCSSCTHSTATTCPPRRRQSARGHVPFAGYGCCSTGVSRRRSIGSSPCGGRQAPGPVPCSALAEAYHRLGFQTLADQVRRSVRSVRGNQWMFRIGHPADHPLRVRPELLARRPTASFPVLRERTPVRMDLSHSAWSDIFFLGMDFPEGARVLNVSIDLGVRGRDAAPRPPVEVYLRVIDEPVLRLVSVDLGARPPTSTDLAEVFDFARDYLGLLKAAVIAVGHRAAGHGRLRTAASPTCWRRWSGRATASNSSARSTTSPKARGWPSRPTCWPA